MTEKKTKKRSKGGFLTLLGALLMILGCLVPYQISLVDESFIQKARILLDLQEFMNSFVSGLPLEQTLIIALVALPLIILLIAILPVLQKEFSKVKIFTLILGLLSLGILIYIGYPLVQASLQGSLMVFAEPGPGLWLYGAGSAVSVLGGLEVL
jgi:Flp pilus assembly pilin Flp